MTHVTISIRMPRDMYDALVALADSDDRSLNYTVRRLLAPSLDATGTPPAETATGFRVAPDRPTQRAYQQASAH